MQRSGLIVRAGWEVPWPESLSPRAALLKRLYATTTRVEADDVPDSFTHEDLMGSLEEGRHPRALFIGYGETNDWAHAGRYDLVLEAAHEADARIAELWNRLQAPTDYRERVTFVITADHGRGSGLKKWRDHGKEIRGAEFIWIGMVGPDILARGEITNAPEVTQSQIAATVAATVGQDFRAANPEAAKTLYPLPSGSFMAPN